MEIDPKTLPSKSVYKLLTGSVVPRPIAWVSTLNADGRPNLAPYSFFNVFGANPPTVVIGVGIRAADHEPKDTYKNIRDTGEFVINIVTEENAEAMNMTAQELPPEVDEFALAGLTPVASKTIQAPRVGESPINFECRVNQIIKMSDEPRGGYLVIGNILHIHIRDDILLGDDKIDLEKLKPIGRLVGNLYSRISEKFELIRPPSQIKIKDS